MRAKFCRAKFPIPRIPEEEKTGLVSELLDIIERQLAVIRYKEELIQQLRDEIARLKGEKPKPQIRPSQLEKRASKKGSSSDKRPGSEKRSKTAKLIIHETIRIAPRSIPPGSVFKGYQAYTVQGIEIRPHNIRYLMERWRIPDGSYRVGQLPPEVKGHFSSTLRSYILYQYYQCHVTQPLLLEQLREWGVDISSGQLNRILIEDKDIFHREKDSVLSVGLKVSSYINVDDTGARHAGKNGYCTHIGNELFAWFASTDNKSRINFLKLLRAGHPDYVINKDALEYMRKQGFPEYLIFRLRANRYNRFMDELTWQEHLEELAITTLRHIRLATEGALLGSILYHGLPKSLVIVSDDAGQYQILNHALCWIHAERTINNLIPSTDQHHKALEAVREQIWDFYNDLKRYKEKPSERKRAQLEGRFDEIFTQKTCYATLNMALEAIFKNKERLLVVLKEPDIPLHNNLSESDLREYVKRRKVSGGTRSEMGRCCRDTFTSLKKTCRKLGISFWHYLNDRICQDTCINDLSELIYLRATAPG
jgi:hypothetical protein